MPDMPESIVLTGHDLRLPGFVAVARHGRHAGTGPDVMRAVEACRAALVRKLEREEIIYGVSTGFGAHVRYFIPPNELKSLQVNVLHALCCGTGPAFEEEAVRGAMLLRANALSKGYSAVRPVVIERLLQLLTAGITPIVPRFGSVGASGDLVPSAYVANVLMGEGEVMHEGAVKPTAAAFQAAGIEPIRIEAKEGLALVNGTTVMTSVAALALHDFDYQAKLMLAAVAMTTEVLKATGDSFLDAIQRLKNHPGQIEAARLLREYSAGSSLMFDLDKLREDIRGARATTADTVEVEHAIQTPYSLRCAPQGLGPVLDSIADAREVIEREMNSVNDNPLVDAGCDAVYHTGNFYGGHIARAMDGLKIDIVNCANWAHSLMAMLMDPRFSNGLPPSLAFRPGLHSGFKGMQLSQTSLVAACRQLANPSSIHTLPTEQYNQDIVSLGLHAASSAQEMTLRLRDALAILTLALCQAADLRGVGKGEARLGAATGRLYSAVRRVAKFVDEDRYMANDIAAVGDLIARHAAGL
ncbi:MAG: aromatic amino acid lyase [Gammaproteobacteria bacterium]|nr:aromatic amino acid lyase [Gammaproteobacteria bacterium]MBI5617960.1 aromatic amino acid lyase [Gammaproteobacteria bacterium]